MPTQRKSARLWLRPARRDKSGRIIARATYLILDGGRHYPTGCFTGEADRAERKLAAYIAEKYKAARKERDLEAIDIADVLSIYVDAAPRLARATARNSTSGSVGLMSFSAVSGSPT
jgi:hypothetical protein